MNKCLRRVDGRHFWIPGVFSYAMMPRCRSNSRVFFFSLSYLQSIANTGLGVLGELGVDLGVMKNLHFLFWKILSLMSAYPKSKGGDNKKRLFGRYRNLHFQ